MNDLISRQDAIDEANAWFLDCFKVQKQDRSCGLIRRLEDLPSADVSPVVHGKWIVKGQEVYCSKCKKTSGYNWHGASVFSKFCPNCGARMDGGR